MLLAQKTHNLHLGAHYSTCTKFIQAIFFALLWKFSWISFFFLPESDVCLEMTRRDVRLCLLRWDKPHLVFTIQSIAYIFYNEIKIKIIILMRSVAVCRWNELLPSELIKCKINGCVYVTINMKWTPYWCTMAKWHCIMSFNLNATICRQQPKINTKSIRPKSKLFLFSSLHNRFLSQNSLSYYFICWFSFSPHKFSKFTFFGFFFHLFMRGKVGWEIKQNRNVFFCLCWPKCEKKCEVQIKNLFKRVKICIVMLTCAGENYRDV